MRDRSPRRTPRQRKVFDLRVERSMARLRQRWGRRFRMEAVYSRRMRLAEQNPKGFVGVILDELRRA